MKENIVYGPDYCFCHLYADKLKLNCDILKCLINQNIYHNCIADEVQVSIISMGIFL